MNMSRPILVVDDDVAIQEFVGRALKAEGYQFVLASNGAEALEAVEIHQPSLILLDMRMPVLDGWGFLKVYCEQSEPRAPVIAFSAHVTGDAPLLCASELLPKPFDLDKLFDLIAKHVLPV
jgi:CheY-like chemotaxis protein